MADLNGSQLAAGAAYLLPALVWSVIAVDLWSSYGLRKPRSRLWRLLPFLTTTVAAFYALGALLWVLPKELFDEAGPGMRLLFVTCDSLLVLAVAMFRHASLLFPIREQPPTRTWTAVNYALPVVLIVPLELTPGIDLEWRLLALRVSMFGYITIMLALSSIQIARFARRGIWRPGGLGEARYADVVMLAVGLLGISAFFLLQISGAPMQSPETLGPFLGGLVGLVLAAPFAVRRLAETLRRCLLAVVSIAVVTFTYVGVARVQTAIAVPELGPLFALASVFVPALVVLAAQAPLRRAIDRVVLRRNLRRRSELHSTLLEVSPDVGIAECCRRALGAIVRVLRLRGAAVALEQDRRWIVEGSANIEPLRRLWDAGVALPGHSSWAETLRELSEEQQEAFIEADVTGTVPIVSPRRRWGHLLFAARGWSVAFSDEDVQTVESFAAALALVLDTAELLERAVSVERSLAHSEKLAAIGELSARVAHEIRNPVTAARSLAQQLLREPGSPFREEHELILQELERVERQVAALLRFARRDEPQLARLDLAALAQSTVEGMRAKLESAGIGVSLDLDGPVPARGDGEKLRQVLLNLIENAADALANGGDRKRVELILRRTGSVAELRVDDSGPGVPDDALPRLFEPFYSRKAHGTGLGLAIAQRIIAAHGGSIEAANAPGGGMSMRVRLPLAGAAAEGGPQ